MPHIASPLPQIDRFRAGTSENWSMCGVEGLICGGEGLMCGGLSGGGGRCRYSTRRRPVGAMELSTWGRSTTNSVRWAGKTNSLSRMALP